MHITNTPDHWIIYLYTNTINNKKYIGLTKRALSKRHFDHVKQARQGNNRPFYRAIRKYGMDTFTLEPIACCLTLETAKEAEEALIRQHRSFIEEHGYNLTHGGEGRFFTKEETENIRKRMTGDKNPMKRPEVAKAVADKLRGRESPSKGKKIEALSGKNNPRYGKKQNREDVERRAKLLRKKYIALHLDGSTETIDHLEKYCKDNGYSYNSMRHSISDKRRYKRTGVLVMSFDEYLNQFTPICSTTG